MASNPESILDSIKKVLGIDSDYTEFDIDVIMHINTAFGSLQQLGVGPITGFAISDSTLLWSDYSSAMVLLAPVKSYIYLTVRLIFDPPATSFAIAAMEKQVAELEWRLNSMAETLIRQPSDPTVGSYWWDLTGLSDFPKNAADGDLGWDSITGEVWAKNHRPGGGQFDWDFWDYLNYLEVWEGSR